MRRFVILVALVLGGCSTSASMYDSDRFQCRKETTALTMSAVVDVAVNGLDQNIIYRGCMKARGWQ